MLVAERQQNIVEMVNERKSIRVTELSRIFSVTEETIRRDLEKLEKEGKLSRSHGGAISVTSPDSLEVPYFEREIMNVNEKREIAVEAVKQVAEGDKLILDASTTAWYMAKSLPNISLTILTNSIKVAMELSSKHQITVISTGGILLSESLSFVGPLAEDSLDNYHVKKAFISCKGLHLDHGISESNEQQARMKKKMIQSADNVYLMIDHSKFGIQTFSHISNLGMINHIIADGKVDGRFIKQLKDKSLHLIKV
ncbi:putative HTH-type transcriptional regulator YulB [Lentibacillus kapialis]|uniref:HTH-type transcriptional regulator YulB n=1 Tax=Lentibacillus kapialis TaxID=340214 RepID=A0A917PTG3_9BACI|nr:DeoR/GlpR family DNA-binding transcription regulator [Lentibacillus kapialis]GGJ91069.1 putative HTH-type transcriptional regulator YulB [Lentibacillus kapialis]